MAITRAKLEKENKTQLVQRMEDYGLEFNEEMTKNEMLDVLMEYIEANTDEEPTNTEVATKDKKKLTVYEQYGVKRFKDLPRHVRADIQKKDLLRKECVIVQDLKNDQTQLPVVHVSWGNDLIGRYTDNVAIDTPEGQYIRRGAIKNLEEVMFTQTLQQKDLHGNERNIKTRTMKRFKVYRVDGFTPDQIEQLKLEQAQKKALEEKIL